MPVKLKIITAVILFIVWGAFVVFGGAPQDAFIEAIKEALVGLGVFTATQAQPPKPPGEQDDKRNSD